MVWSKVIVIGLPSPVENGGGVWTDPMTVLPVSPPENVTPNVGWNWFVTGTNGAIVLKSITLADGENSLIGMEMGLAAAEPAASAKIPTPMTLTTKEPIRRIGIFIFNPSRSEAVSMPNVDLSSQICSSRTVLMRAV
jgi:hypothetical protein